MDNGFSFINETEYYVLNLNFLELSLVNSKIFSKEWRSKIDQHWLINCDKIEKHVRLVNVGGKLNHCWKKSYTIFFK